MKNAYYKGMYRLFRFLENSFYSMGNWCNDVKLRNQVKIERTQEEIDASIKMMHDIRKWREKED